MRSFLSLFFCFIFSTITIGQHDGDVDYDALAMQILKDIPLDNFKNEPTFLRVSYAVGYDIIEEGNKNHGYQTKESYARKHFWSQKNLARLQSKIKTALIPYFESQSMDRIIAFYGNPIVKRWPGIMPTFKTISHKKLTYTNTKKGFGYFPYNNQPVHINIQKQSLYDYIEKANHIKLEFIHKPGNKVRVTGAVNRKKVVLLYQWIYGKWQQVPEFRVTDITHYNHEGRLFIKHHDITFEYEKEFDLDDATMVSQTSVAPVHKESFQQKNVISIDSIVNTNFSDVQNIKFTYKNEDTSEKYEFFQFNSELFVLTHQYKHNNRWHVGDATFYAYKPISITKNKRMYRLFGEDTGVIIPEKDGVHVYLTKIEQLHDRKDFLMETQQRNYQNYNTATLARITNHLDFEQYYTVKEEKEGKWMYNYLGLRKLDNVYDSIFVDNFIVGIKDGRYDIYNQALQKLPLKNVRAFHLENSATLSSSNYIPHTAQIIHHNSLKTISLSFKENDKSTPNKSILCYGLPTADVHLKISKVQDHFHIKSVETIPFIDYKIPLRSNKIDSIYFLGNKQKSISYKPTVTAYKLDLNEIIHVKTKQGVQNVYHTSYINEPTSPFIKKALEEVAVYSDCIRFKENHLYGYYGIHDKGRFTTLDAFEGFFARFELPNGQKGWLDRNGKEYLDI